MAEGLVGVVLAAGAGTRFGMPKALARDDAGAWLPRACGLLADAGCSTVIAVLGAGAEEARHLLPHGAHGVVAERWREGIGASLHAGIEVARAVHAQAVLVTLVDLPHLEPEAVTRVAALWTGDPTVLARANDGGSPGHPVLVGGAHLGPLLATVGGSRGAAHYLSAHHVTEVDCTGLGAADDVDAQ
ncbi:nucleotidyltransferase family protein [Demequina lignilytica]|uniref:NTP transferase domain-containing protein n=1 Tax=Demequina lignilytica TaxID=3051663 RepID=A0AAW7M5G6_9MICO|nr:MULTISPECIES: NTP transferase domain-containing protein [unclassified Demequina]MDN4478807.1 NTP transferase domain-containing protein [Demequina sp. SYSU T00039-1]MDN4484094.1 NTP transferase domain-containing protein [Demequina sp. SYSU T0a273]MDN4488905.1 NTP transferase domain-containing protein [Demequina sp. SYSU T00039]MDN4490323.1 NTP transferase domain-containing protein [Demequina sp. SYSU T00068]